jgi:hypothetical protein
MRLDVDKLFRNKEKMTDNVLTKERREVLVNDLVELARCMYSDGADCAREGISTDDNFELARHSLGFLINMVIDSVLADES